MPTGQPSQNFAPQAPQNPGFAPAPPAQFQNIQYANTLQGGAPQNGKGTAALILGIIGLFLFPVIFSILAIILGAQGKNLAARGLATNRGAAQAGFVMGIIGLVLGALLFFVILGFA